MRDRVGPPLPGVPLVIVESPYRALAGPLVAYLDVLDRAWPPDKPHPITFVVIPEYVARHWWERILYNQSARRLRSILLGRPHTVVVDVPYRRDDRAGRRPARDAGSDRRTGTAPSRPAPTTPPTGRSGRRARPRRPDPRPIGDDGRMPATLAISWDELDALVARLADEVGRDHDVVLAITRGGLVPAGMLAVPARPARDPRRRRRVLPARRRHASTTRDRPLPGRGAARRAAGARDRRGLGVRRDDDRGARPRARRRRPARVRRPPLQAGRGPASPAGPDHFAAEVDSWVAYPYKAGA